MRSVILKEQEIRDTLDGKRSMFLRPIPNIGEVINWGYIFPNQKYFGIEIDFPHQYGRTKKIAAPHGQAGDVLWVKERFCYDNKEYVQTYKDEPWRGDPDPTTAECYYRATESDPTIFPGWIPSPSMPRWASRLGIEIVSVRVQRVQRLSPYDIEATGIESSTDNPILRAREIREKFIKEWNKTAPAKRYSRNPWAWLYTYKAVEL
jgi:hypothetical protein